MILTQDLFYTAPRHTPVAATTVCNTPDDGGKLRPKHVEF